MRAAGGLFVPNVAPAYWVVSSCAVELGVAAFACCHTRSCVGGAAAFSLPPTPAMRLSERRLVGAAVDSVDAIVPQPPVLFLDPILDT